MIKFQRWFCTPKSRILVPQNSAPLDEQNPVKWSGEACFWFCYSCNDKARLAHDFARLCLRHSVKNTRHKPPSRLWRRTSCDFEFCSALSHLVTLAMILLELAFSPAKSRIQNPESWVNSQDQPSSTTRTQEMITIMILNSGFCCVIWSFLIILNSEILDFANVTYM